MVFQNENSLDAHEAALCQAQSSLQYLNGSTRITVEYDGIENAVQDSGTFLLPNSVLFGDDLPSDLDACRADLVCAIKFHRDIVTRLRSDVDDAKKDLLLMVSSEDERIQFVADKQGRLEQGCPSTRDDPDTSSEVCSSVSPVSNVQLVANKLLCRCNVFGVCLPKRRRGFGRRCSRPSTLDRSIRLRSSMR